MNNAALRRRCGWTLFLFLLSVYLLNFSGYPESSDSIAMLATAESMVRRGDLDMNAYLWMGLQQGSFGTDGELYSRKTMGQVLISLPLTWVGLRSNLWGVQQATMLTGAVVAAATALCLYVILLALEISLGAAAVTALFYGLATPALPYSKYFFNDPLTALALLAALLAVILYRRQPNKKAAILCGAALGFAALTRTTSLAAMPFYVLALWWPDWRNWRRWLRTLPIADLFAFALPFAANLGLSGLFNYWRYGNPLASGYLPQESFSGNWLVGIAGLLFSPGRGLFLYAPLLIAAAIAWPMLHKRNTAAAWLALAVSAVHVLIYGKWFMWHGGYCWGPRFLFPAIPLLALALGPAWEKGRRWRLAVLSLAAVSLVPQLLGSLVPFALFQDALLQTGLPLFAPRTFWLPRYSPLVEQWHYIAPANLDFAWMQVRTITPDWLSLALLLALTCFAAWTIWRAWHKQQGKWLLPVTTILWLLVAGIVLARAHIANQPALAAALRLVQTQEKTSDALILAEPQFSLPVSDYYKGKLPVYGLSQGEYGWLERLGRERRRLWLLRPDGPLEQEAAELALAQWGYQLSQTNGGGWRLALYEKPAAELQTAKTGAFAGGIALSGAAQMQDNALLVRLEWQTENKIEKDYKVFVHVYAADGALLAQDDSMPALWQRPTSTWQAGEVVSDKHGLLLPPRGQPAYILIGLYDPQNGTRLLAADGADSVRLAVGP